MPIIIESPMFCRHFNIAGISLGIAIIVEDKNNKVLINHECIHQAQWRELWFIGFLPWYLWESYQHGYRNNCFEKEAYANQHNFNYLLARKRFAFLDYGK